MYASRLRIVRWGAAAACGVAALLAMREGDWLRAAGLGCIGVTFALLATETRAAWSHKKTAALVFVLASLIILTVRILG